MLEKETRAIFRARTVAALGLVTEDTSQFEVAAIFSAVINDQVVDQRARALGCEEGTCVRVADYQDYAEIVESMSPEEKQDLRKRIGR